MHWPVFLSIYVDELDLIYWLVKFLDVSAGSICRDSSLQMQIYSLCPAKSVTLTSKSYPTKIVLSHH
jgi:hypothetical protein